MTLDWPANAPNWWGNRTRCTAKLMMFPGLDFLFSIVYSSSPSRTMYIYLVGHLFSFLSGFFEQVHTFPYPRHQCSTYFVGGRKSLTVRISIEFSLMKLGIRKKIKKLTFFSAKVRKSYKMRKEGEALSIPTGLDSVSRLRAHGILAKTTDSEGSRNCYDLAAHAKVQRWSQENGHRSLSPGVLWVAPSEVLANWKKINIFFFLVFNSTTKLEWKGRQERE